jgi:hypothetical protein
MLGVRSMMGGVVWSWEDFDDVVVNVDTQRIWQDKV